MDEADLLGDRIAIISQGKLKACGSSLFLKSEFGQGYSLRLVRREPTPLPNKHNQLTVGKTPITIKKLPFTENLKAIVQNHVPGATILDDVGFEIVILLPYSSLNSFSALFEDLDKSLEALGMSGYGISDTTLEDVFLKITIGDLEDNGDNFDCLSSSSKRRCVDMLKRIRRSAKTEQNGPRAPKNVCQVKKLLVDPEGRETPIEEQRVWDSTNGNHSHGIVTEIGLQIENDVSLLDESINGEDLPVRPPHRHELQSPSCLLFLVQVYVINMKRWWNSLRNIKAMFFEVRKN